MVASCANPTCARQFHQLSQGRLFLLPPEGCLVDRLSDYCYWLCPECSAQFTMIRHEGEVVLLVHRQSHVSPPIQVLNHRMRHQP